MLARKSGKQAACCVLATIVSTYSGFIAGQQPDLNKQQQQLTELRNSISKIKNWINQAQGKQSKLVNELRLAEQRINKNLRQIQDLQNNISSLQIQLKTLKQKEAGQLETLRQHKHLLAQQVRAAYAMGQEQGIKLLLNAEDPATLQRLINYYGYFSNARGKQIAHSREIIKDLQQTRSEILSKNQTLIDSRNKLAKNQQELESGRTQRKSTLAKLNQQLEGKQNQLVQMERDHQQLELLVKELEKTIATIELTKDSVPFKKLRGKLAWPTSGTLLSEFGSTNKSDFRSPGVFFKTPVNQPINAVHHGRVVFADWLRGFGLLLILDHGDDYMSLYGFNQALLKDTGDWVRGGEVIASAGNSGGQTQSGLYFEIRHKGKPGNPARWLQKQPPEPP